MKSGTGGQGHKLKALHWEKISGPAGLCLACHSGKGLRALCG